MQANPRRAVPCSLVRKQGLCRRIFRTRLDKKHAIAWLVLNNHSQACTANPDF